MQLSLRTLVSRTFDAAEWVIIRTLSGVQVASKSFGWATSSVKPHRLLRFLAGDHYGKGKSIRNDH